MMASIWRLGPATTAMLAIAAAAIAAGLAAVVGDPSLLESWLLGFAFLAGVSSGALALLLIGHLLGEAWLTPIRDELEAIADLIPMVAVLALPLLLHPAAVYPWAATGGGREPAADWLDPQFFAFRSILYLAVWIGLASLAKRRRYPRMTAGIGLLALAPTMSLAAIDWFASREPEWISGLYGPAFAVSQLLFAMSFGLLVTLLRPGHPARVAVESLRIGLFALALLTLWTWYTQFLVVWMADLPAEAAWYLARADDWAILQAITVAALVAAAILLVAPHAARTRMAIAAGLLIVQHLAHTVWLIRPAAPAVVPLPLDAAVLLGLLGVWLLFLAIEVSRRRNLMLARHKP